MLSPLASLASCFGRHRASVEDASAAGSAVSQETWANGVRHVREDSVDRYELPATRPGVPAHIVRTPRFLRPARVEATDRDGRILAARMAGWPGARVLRVRGGLDFTTTLDPRTHRVTVETPATERRCIITPANISHCYTHVPAKQRLEPDGSTTFHVDQDSERVRGICRDYTEVQAETLASFPRGAAPIGQRLLWSGEVEPLSVSAPDAEGHFTVSHPLGGDDARYQLFLTPR